jgi:[ribosomal protein S18]-alanine N-acetyltransferase
MMATKGAMRASPIRWAIQRDLADMLEIERLCFADPWTEQEFKDFLRQRNAIGMVYDSELSLYTNRTDIHGFIVYELHKTKLVIKDLAVHPFAQRRGVGREIIAKMKGKLNEAGRNRIVADVSEKNLDGQLFFKSCGFEAVGVVPQFFRDDQDSFRFVYRFS